MNIKNKLKYYNILEDLKKYPKQNANIINIDDINLTYKKINLIQKNNYFVEKENSAHKDGGSIFIFH
jgi:hypothetical protein